MEAKPRIPTLVKVAIGAVLVVVVVTGYFYLLPWVGFGQERDMRMTQTGHEVVYGFDSGAAFHSNNSRFFFFSTRSGISYVASNEVISWNETFSFNRSRMESRGDFVAVSEEDRGRRVYVFGAAGLLFRADFEAPVRFFSVNETGFLSVIVQYDNEYGIYVLNEHRPTVSNPVFSRTVTQEMHIPLYVEVSADGTYAAIAITDVSSNVSTLVEFRYINQWDAWGTDRGLFAGETFDNQLVLTMRFMNDNKLIIATTSRITCFQLGPGHQVYRELWTINLQNAISYIDFLGGSHFAFVTGDRLAGENDGDPVGTVRIIGANGIQTGIYEFGRRVTHLRMGHNAVIIGSDRTFRAVNLRGELLWSHTTLHDTSDVLFLDDTSTILVAGSIRAEIYRRQRVRENGIGDLFGERDSQ